MVKKIIVIVILACIYYGIQYHQTDTKRIEVLYDDTIDGDTVYLIENGQRQKYRLLLIDTPEATSTVEPFGLEATELTMQLLENASLIEIEYQLDNETEDRYGRKLVWVFIDGTLLQKELAKAGLVEKLYDNGGNYTYKNEIEAAIYEAKYHQVGLYQK